MIGQDVDCNVPLLRVKASEDDIFHVLDLMYEVVYFAFKNPGWDVNATWNVSALMGGKLDQGVPKLCIAARRGGQDGEHIL